VATVDPLPPAPPAATVVVAVETVESPDDPLDPPEEDASGTSEENSLPPHAIATSSGTSHRAVMRIEPLRSAYPLGASQRQ
jgi:hypothetical protein